MWQLSKHELDSETLADRWNDDSVIPGGRKLYQVHKGGSYCKNFLNYTYAYIELE